MAIKNITYSREFTSETSKKNISTHGSPEMIPYQNISPKDEAIRDKAESKFRLYTVNNYQGYFGSDSEINYIFRFLGSPIKNDNLRENVTYRTSIVITKSGSRENLDKLSDIEEFIINEGFEETKIKQLVNQL